MLANNPGTVARRAPMSVSDMRIEADVRIAAGSDSPRFWKKQNKMHN